MGRQARRRAITQGRRRYSRSARRSRRARRPGRRPPAAPPWRTPSSSRRASRGSPPRPWSSSGAYATDKLVTIVGVRRHSFDGRVTTRLCTTTAACIRTSPVPDRAAGPGDEPRRPADHMATTASRSLSAAPFVAGAPSGSSARACDSLAYSFFERPDSISRVATTTSVFQWRLRHCQVSHHGGRVRAGERTRPGRSGRVIAL